MDNQLGFSNLLQGIPGSEKKILSGREDMLARYMREKGPTAKRRDPVFVNRWNHPLTYRNLYDRMQKIGRRQGTQTASHASHLSDEFSKFRRWHRKPSVSARARVFIDDTNLR